MNVVSITEPSARVKIEPHPPEDYTLCSTRYPIFLVADGVTLASNGSGHYPKFSGAAEAARVFCEAALRAAESRYVNFIETDLLAVFRAGNRAVGKYNRAQGRTKETIDYFAFDLFAATAAFVLLKDEKLYWFSLCDSYVFVFETAGREKFVSPEPWRVLQGALSKLGSADPSERRKTIHREYRNCAGPVGYGTTTGEKAAENYLNLGTIILAPGDFFALYTDGFECYFALPEFLSLFKSWPLDLEEKIKTFTAKKEKENPELFGHERSLIAVRS